MRLIATGFSKPPAATALPRKISAMPPTPMRSSSSYRVTCGQPSTVKMCDMDAIARLLDDALASGLGSAAAISVGDAGVEVLRHVAGHTRRVPDRGEPITTVAIAMVLVAERALDLDAPVRTYLPTASTTGTVRQLLGHSAGCAAH